MTTALTGKTSGSKTAAPVRLGRVRLYTFGAPRVGNSEFARDFDAMGLEAYRIVNGIPGGRGGSMGLGVGR